MTTKLPVFFATVLLYLAAFPIEQLLYNINNFIQ
jgi:hypothetical protein